MHLSTMRRWMTTGVSQNIKLLLHSCFTTISGFLVGMGGAIDPSHLIGAGHICLVKATPYSPQNCVPEAVSQAIALLKTAKYEPCLLFFSI